MPAPDRLPTTTEWIELHRLQPPETDVRSNRDPDDLRALAQSLERSGQLQAAKVYPANWDEFDEETRQQSGALVDMIDQAAEFVVVDGWSRREAARIANWDRLRCEIFPEPPEDQVIASLDANTERLEMDDYETIRALHDWKEETGATQQDVADKIGKSRSRVANLFRALDAYEPVVTAWQDPDTHIEVGHVLAIEQLPEDDLKEKVLQDALQYDRSVSMTRETAKNTLKGWKRDQKTERSKEAAEKEGTARQAAQEKAAREAAAAQDPPCILCGDQGGHTIALPVCQEDYGLLTRKKETGEPLLADLAADDVEPAEADD